MVKLIDIFYRFFILGLVSFGGPIAHIAYFKKTFVDKLKWLDDENYSKIVALSQFLPGPSSSQVGFTHQMTSSMVGAHDMRAQLPESVRAAFAEVTHLMRGAFLTRSSQLDARQGRKKPYYSTIIEQTARAFESVVAHRLEQRGWRNEFLVNFTDPEVWRLAQDTVLKNWLDAETLNCMEHPSSYPYLLPNEIPEVDIAYEKLMQVVLDADHNRESDFQVWQPSQEDSDDDYEYEYEDRPFVDYSYARQGSLF